MQLKIDRIDDVGTDLSLRVIELTLYCNTNYEIRELGKIIPSPGYPCGEINILLSGLKPLTGTNVKYLSLVIQQWINCINNAEFSFRYVASK